jgi:hypothetical protein
VTEFAIFKLRNEAGSRFQIVALSEIHHPSDVKAMIETQLFPSVNPAIIRDIQPASVEIIYQIHLPTSRLSIDHRHSPSRICSRHNDQNQSLNNQYFAMVLVRISPNTGLAGRH